MAKWYGALLVLVLLLGMNRHPLENNKQEAQMERQSMNTYQQMTMEEARVLFAAQPGLLIVDVRMPTEYAEGHIPGAINVPNETIDTTPPEQLPDKNQTMYVYCRSGNRSKQAATKLAAMGYTGVIEFGGILDWEGELEE